MARNSRKSANTRTRFTQKLDKRAETPRVVRVVHLPNGTQAAIAEVNGVYLLARFDANEAPLDARPMVFGGANGQSNAFQAVSDLAGHRIRPIRMR